MTLPKTHNLSMVFLLVILVLTPSYIQPAISSQVLNTGTVLFTNMDCIACCIETERYATLVFRQLLTSIIAVPLQQVRGDAYIVAFVTFVHASARKVIVSTPPVVARSFVLALFDTVGGYLRTYLLPVSLEGFYAGNVRLNELSKLFSLYSDIKDYLHTNGESWRPPITKYGVNHKVRPLDVEKSSADETEACENFIFSTGDNTSGSMMPIPFLDDNANPGSIALPLRYGALHSIESFESAYVVVSHYVRSQRCLQTKNLSPSVIKEYNTQFKQWLVACVIPRLKDEKWYPAFGGILRVLRAVGEKGQNAAKHRASRQIRKKRLVGTLENFNNKMWNMYQNRLLFSDQQDVKKNSHNGFLNDTSNEMKRNKIQHEQYNSKGIETYKNEDKIEQQNYILKKQYRRFARYIEGNDEQKKTSNINSHITDSYNDISRRQLHIYKLNYTNSAINNSINKGEARPPSVVKAQNELEDSHRSNLPVELKAQNLVGDDDFVPIEEMILRKFMLPHPLKNYYVTSMSIWREPVNWKEIINNRPPRNEGGRITSSTTAVSPKSHVHTISSQRDPGFGYESEYSVSLKGRDIAHPAAIKKFYNMNTYNNNQENRVFKFKDCKPNNVRNSEHSEEIPRKRKLKCGEIVSTVSQVHSTKHKSQIPLVKSLKSNINKDFQKNQILKSPNIANIENALVDKSGDSEKDEAENNNTSFTKRSQTNSAEDIRTICISTCITIGDWENPFNNKISTKPTVEHNLLNKATAITKRTSWTKEEITQDTTTNVNMDPLEVLKPTMLTSSDHKGVKIYKGIVNNQAEKIILNNTTARTKVPNSNETYNNKENKNRTVQWKDLDYKEAKNSKMRQSINNDVQECTPPVGSVKLSQNWPEQSLSWTDATPIYTALFGNINVGGKQWKNVTETCVQRIWDGKHAAAPVEPHFLCDVLQSPILNLDFYACHIIVTLFVWLLLFCASIGNDDMQWRCGLYSSRSCRPSQKRVVCPRDSVHEEFHPRGTCPKETFLRESYPRGACPRECYSQEIWQLQSRRKESIFPCKTVPPIYHSIHQNNPPDRDGHGSHEPRTQAAPITAFMDHRFRCIPWQEKEAHAERIPLYSSSKSTTLPPSTNCQSHPHITSDLRVPTTNAQHPHGKKPPVMHLMPIKRSKFNSESEPGQSDDEQHTIDEP